MLINSLKILDIVCIIEDIKNIQRYKKKTFKKWITTNLFHAKVLFLTIRNKSFTYYKKEADDPMDLIQPMNHS